MNPLLQNPMPGVSATYRLVWVPGIPAFAVVESEEQLKEGAEWWLPVPVLPALALRDPSWDGPFFSGPHYMVDIVGVVSERGRYGANGDHVRQILVQSYSNPVALPCR